MLTTWNTPETKSQFFNLAHFVVDVVYFIWNQVRWGRANHATDLILSDWTILFPDKAASRHNNSQKLRQKENVQINY